MANHHYGEIGNIWGHLALAEALGSLRPREYWESHAGSAKYPIVRTRTTAYGLFLLLERAPISQAVQSCAFMQALPSQNIAELTFWPGSPVIALRILGRKAKYILCELDCSTAAGLEADIAEPDGQIHSEVVRSDGLLELAARSQGLTRSTANSVLVHIDPFDPFAGPNGIDAIDLQVLLTTRGVPTIHWYDYGDPAKEEVKAPGWIYNELLNRVGQAYPVWAVELSSVCGRPLHDGGYVGFGVTCTNMEGGILNRVVALAGEVCRLYSNTVAPSGVRGDLAFSAYA